MTSLRLLLIVAIAQLASGCAQNFPRPNTVPLATDGPGAAEVFDRSFLAHGGASLDQFHDLNIAMDGDWKFLITRIQPLVTDHKYRVVSEERLLPLEGVYTAFYKGPDGTKKVVRKGESVRVFYNGEESFDEDVLQSTALTADAFFLFHIGPLALREHRADFVRLEDGVEKGKRYYRLHATIEPGFGFSTRDEVVLWIDPETDLTWRIHITLEGYETTKGAHVDVTNLDFEKRGPFILPTRFVEHVRGPIGIKAHNWEWTGLDINRGVVFSELDGEGFSGSAEKPATVLVRQAQ